MEVIYLKQLVAAHPYRFSSDCSEQHEHLKMTPLPETRSSDACQPKARHHLQFILIYWHIWSSSGQGSTAIMDVSEWQILALLSLNQLWKVVGGVRQTTGCTSQGPSKGGRDFHCFPCARVALCCHSFFPKMRVMFYERYSRFHTFWGPWRWSDQLSISQHPCSWLPLAREAHS